MVLVAQVPKELVPMAPRVPKEGRLEEPKEVQALVQPTLDLGGLSNLIALTRVMDIR